jgi:Flp pilus assembly secretin CpaC
MKRLHLALSFCVFAMAATATPAVAQVGPDEAAPEFRREHTSIQLDLATTGRVPAGTRTLLIGNPAIADAALIQTAENLMVLTGKSYGVTNVLALDQNGAPIREFVVTVKQAGTRTVTVLRGTSRETWHCAPKCEQTMTLGDNQEFFGQSGQQAGVRNAAASAR